uniref:NADH dehydrogenase [ubiquinone] 1 beta subcomplex subunit 4 n=1 Tax=Strongyloides papillosus TaxID=174720 RepID=A0A0N5B2H3_STREA
MDPSDPIRAVTFDHKDPYEAWTDRLHRRNWDELVPMDLMTHRGDRFTFTGFEEKQFRFWTGCLIFLRVLFPMGVLGYIFTNSDQNTLK